MAKKQNRERSLPQVPRSAWGRTKHSENAGDADGLLADRIAAAMAEGNIEDFLKEEIPDNQHARNLVNIMMGMTGMMPEQQDFTPISGSVQTNAERTTKQETEDNVIDDVKSAVHDGDMQKLIDILKRESGQEIQTTRVNQPATTNANSPTISPTIEQELIDSLISIASENNVTLDWIILRAIKTYVHTYRKKGTL